MVKQAKWITQKKEIEPIKTEIKDIEILYHQDLESIKKAVLKNTNWRMFQQVLCCLSMMFSIFIYLVMNAIIISMNI